MLDTGGSRLAGGGEPNRPPPRATGEPVASLAVSGVFCSGAEGAGGGVGEVGGVTGALGEFVVGEAERGFAEHVVRITVDRVDDRDQ